MPQIIPRAFFAEFASENAGENGFGLFRDKLTRRHQLLVS
jgi:hypothetical protein